MPVPLLPILGGLTAGAGIAQAAGNISSTAKSKKKNKTRIDELLALKNEGRFGLTDSEQQALDTEGANQIRRVASQARSRAEQLGATAGIRTGGDLAGLRQEGAELEGRVGRDRANSIRQASAARAREQEGELAAREGLNADYRTDQFNSAFGALRDSLGAVAEIDGVNPLGNFGALGGSLSRAKVDEAAKVAGEQPEEVAAAVQKLTAAQQLQRLSRPLETISDLRFVDGAEGDATSARVQLDGVGPGDRAAEVRLSPQPDPALTARLGYPAFRLPDGTAVVDMNRDGNLFPVPPELLALE